MSSTGYGINRKRRCGFGPSTQSATSRQRAGLGPRRKTRLRGRSATSLRLRRKTRRPRSFAALARKVSWNSQKLHGDLQRNMQTTEWVDENSNDVREKYPILFRYYQLYL
eukprot:TRINITY_DN19_c0_g1_i19.p1 TRINITY_DN19_c0_g1~~TRINITY_DN19_c0_g1_i19.p1  ORF type:complete len:110 (-),score=20.36 TRINITY_DN19_c0_g1_i19:47-376(-)